MDEPLINQKGLFLWAQELLFAQKGGLRTIGEFSTRRGDFSEIASMLGG
jgi:hypothetical protein